MKGAFKSTWRLLPRYRRFCSGFEAWYSHYKNNFRYKAQWTPVVVAPLLMAAGVGAVRNQRIAQRGCPPCQRWQCWMVRWGLVITLAVFSGGPVDLKMPVYNIIHGPPIFAPLLFAAAGFIGLLASLLRREKA